MTSPVEGHSCLALDIGGTKAEAGVVRPDGTVHHVARIAVAGNDRLFDDIIALLHSVNHHEPSPVLGVACAGPMMDKGATVSPLNIPQWRDFPLRDRLVEVLGMPVAVEGDVRALALAEGRFGAAQGVANYASMVVSTGVGGALVIDGRLLDGRTGNAGHLGHVWIDAENHQCSCGARGCLEAVASGWAINRTTGNPAEQASAEIRRQTAHFVGAAVGNLASVLDFDRCFVGGSVALGFGSDFFETATTVARECAPMHFTRDLQILPTGLGPHGALLGAALVGWAGQP
jgi:glucokinase